MSSKIPLVQGDALPRITLTITDLDDNLVSIAGCTGATVHWRAVGGSTVTAIVADVDTGAGTVAFDFSGGVLNGPAGEYEAEVELDFSGKPHTLYRPFKFKVRAQFDQE